MLISKFDTENIEMKIAHFEERNSILLPEQYKTFLGKYNGGQTPNTTFKVGKISSDIRAFFGIDSPEYGFVNEEVIEWIQKGLLPIAEDSFGNYIAIGLVNDKAGKIFFCDHEKGYKISPVGKDFKSFVDSCTSEEISPISKWSIKEREDNLIAKGRGHVITDYLRKAWQAEIDFFRNLVQEEVIL